MIVNQDRPQATRRTRHLDQIPAFSASTVIRWIANEYDCTGRIWRIEGRRQVVMSPAMSQRVSGMSGGTVVRRSDRSPS